MADFDISLVTSGLIRNTGNFSERMVSRGYIGDITTGPGALATIHKIFFNAWNFVKGAISNKHKGL